MLERMIRAARGESALYEEVERDVDATGQAALVVLLVAVCSAIGAVDNGVTSAIVSIPTAFIGWVLWAAITYFVGSRIFATSATRVTLGEMLRTLGFAEAPGVLLVLGLVPILGNLVIVVAGIWTLVLGIIAIRAAMDFSTGRAIATAVVGFIPYAILSALIAAVL